MDVGQRVTIEAPDRGRCFGRVEALSRVEDLPTLPAMSIDTADAATQAQMAREVLTSWNVTRVAMISYRPSPNQQLLFAALEIGGEWFDLQRQRLTIRELVN